MNERCDRCNWPEEHRAHKPPLGKRYDEESGSANGGRVVFTSHAFVPPETKQPQAQRIGGYTREEATAVIDKAHATVSDLCHGRQRWTMRVPAQPDSDPDLVIGAALRLADALLAAAFSEAPTVETETRGHLLQHPFDASTDRPDSCRAVVPQQIEGWKVCGQPEAGHAAPTPEPRLSEEEMREAMDCATVHAAQTGELKTEWRWLRPEYKMALALVQLAAEGGRR